MARTKPPYTPEFRSEAVRLARTSGLPPAQIARDLGCCTETLKSWMRQTAINEGKAGGLTSEEREELRRLRREVLILREERPNSNSIASGCESSDTLKAARPDDGRKSDLSSSSINWKASIEAKP
jgi:transposase